MRMSLPAANKTFLASLIVVLLAGSFAGGYFTAISFPPLSSSELQGTKPYTPEKIVIGFIPTDKATEFTPKAEGLSRLLADNLGVRVEALVPTTYEPLIEGLRFGKVHVAFLDTGPAWIAVRKSFAEVVAAEDQAGETYYYSVLFVRKDSAIGSLRDIVGKRIAFTSVTGSGGFILPAGKMVEAGLLRPKGEGWAGVEAGLKDIFSKYVFAGSYGQALELLAKGEVDVAAGSLAFFESQAKPEIKEQIRVLEKLGRVPSHVLVISKTLPEDWRLKITLAFINLNKDENRHILRELYGVDALVATTAEAHLEEFGKAIDSLTGIVEKKWGIKP